MDQIQACNLRHIPSSRVNFDSASHEIGYRNLSNWVSHDDVEALRALTVDYNRLTELPVSPPTSLQG